jgi:hypothetical protein
LEQHSKASDPSGQKLLQLFDANDFKIISPQCPTHYSLVGSGDVLDVAVHNNTRLSSVVVSDILDSDYLPIIFNILDHVRTTELLEHSKNLLI